MKFCVGDIEELMLAAFPLSDALSNDRNGLFVGDRSTLVKRIGLALDQSVPMVEAAFAQGCNLLLTHHPPFIYAPDSFLAAPSPGISDGATIYAAAQKGIALLNMHTNLDCSPIAKDMLLAPVGLEFVRYLRPYGSGGLGQIGRVISQENNNKPYISLGALASAYKSHFGNLAKAWGDVDKPLFSVATCSGGASEVVREVIAAGVDCFITGELRHHEALYLADAGISLIELGHDTSELAYREVLQHTLTSAGFPNCDIVVLAPSATWWQP